MIISHKHKFIFIHIPKCAGSTICYSLINNLYLKNSPHKGSFNQLDPSIAEVFKVAVNQGNSHELNQHDTLKDIKSYLSKKNLNINDYFKFSFMRNPWERRVSQYFYAKRMAKKDFEWAKKISAISFYEFITKRNPDSQLNWVSDKKDNIAVDFLGSGKNLQNEFNVVCEKIGISYIQLPYKNVTNHKHYTEYYNDETFKIIANNCKKDIEYFNYKFGE